MTGVVVAALAVQIVVLNLPESWTVAVAVTIPAIALGAGLFRPRQLIRATGGVIIMLLAVLAARQIAEPGWAAFRSWMPYSSRILSAVMIALVLIQAFGPSAVHRGLSGLLRPLPRSLRIPLLDIVAAAMYLIPAARRHMSASNAAARIRLSRSRYGILRRTVAVSRAGLVSVASLPPLRAEAMVVRGLTGDRIRGVRN